MNRKLLVLAIICLFYTEMSGQNSYPKDSIKHSIGIQTSIDILLNDNLGFIKVGLDYNYRLNSRFGLGFVGTYGFHDDKRDYLLNFNPYFRTDLSVKKISPFFDLGLGYKSLTFTTKLIEGVQGESKKYNDYYISTRLGFCFFNKRKFNTALFFSYQMMLESSDYVGDGVQFNYKI